MTQLKPPVDLLTQRIETGTQPIPFGTPIVLVASWITGERK